MCLIYFYEVVIVTSVGSLIYNDIVTEAAQGVEKWYGHNIDSSVRRGVGFGEGAVSHPQVEKFLIF